MHFREKAACVPPIGEGLMRTPVAVGVIGVVGQVSRALSKSPRSYS